MPLELQSKLLRVLETKSYRPVGAHKPLQADVRIVTATNRDLQALTADDDSGKTCSFA
jgi:transcriptional regulator with PAS, ATPase and Fis domain